MSANPRPSEFQRVGSAAAPGVGERMLVTVGVPVRSVLWLSA